MDFAPPFGAWLKVRRRQLDLTQVELAKRAHYSTESIRKVEERAHPASRALATALLVPLDIPDCDQAAFIAFARGVDVRQRLNHLPVPLTPMIGRETELAALKALLAPGGTARLITLTGPPGVGKSRLAMQLAHDLQPIYADGASFVALASISDGAHIPTAIANTLRQRALGGRPSIEAISAYLGPRELLLTLDNFEHLLDGATLISDLVSRCPRLRVLITSRALLGILGEHVVEVKPLERAPAIALFVRQASAVKPAFALTPENGVVVGEICGKLDGLPLAIELAAARSRMLTPARLLERLTHHTGARFDLLTSGPRDADARQRTLSATIDWSYALLNDTDKRFFRRLGVFVGGCALDGAAAVCCDDGDTAIAEALIQSLLDKSLIYESEGLDGSPRFAMLEMVREYARLRLEDTGETDRMLRRLTEYLNILGDAARPYVPKADQTAWLKRLASERDNIFAALAWCRSPNGDYSLGLRLAGRIGWVVSWGSLWNAYMPIDDARGWMDDIEERVTALPPEIQAATVYGVFDLVQCMGDWESARRLFEPIREIARRTGDTRTAWHMLWVECAQRDLLDRDFASAVPFYEQMIADSEEGSVWRALAQGMYGRALAANGQPGRAITLLEAGLEIWRKNGIVWTMLGGTSTLHFSLAQAHAWQGDFEAARSHAERATAEFLQVGWTAFEASRLGAMAALANGSVDGFIANARRHFGLPPVITLGRGPTHPVSTGFAIDAARCVLTTARAALAAWHGAFPDQIWPALLILIAREYVALGQNQVAFRLFGAASAHEIAHADTDLGRSISARLAERRAQALTDASLFEQWRVGERMSQEDVAGLLGKALDPTRPRTTHGGAQTNPGGRQNAAGAVPPAVEA
ncbi:MAG TPA: helix-turn-helix domain-containing protein [Thermoflexales bacterium]|nr:helix-turn-helix domain-containing protein [Thermoflexales bacterium]HQX11721.1 helix-turn-helix domain-containing protein [Thermoflexales bacterium]HQY23794.1 helix-turn-helix domain-containing protein [Thermoflexales bacterium]HQZ54442.1 helix-turn-helix domain-containing protein [Thermoflexales bacterium]HRA55113.1 helix-turn-helix domain-containing protein [Thermoflexales bacterium]